MSEMMPTSTNSVVRWDKKTHDAAQKERQEEQDGYRPDARTKPPEKERASISEQAKALLAGEEKWKPTGGLWENVGEEVEVETEVEVPKIEE
jgi:large subunit ribosomal protein L23